MKDELTKEQQDGIKMIKFLQKIASIVETDETAFICWEKMNDIEKQQTQEAYRIFNERIRRN